MFELIVDGKLIYPIRLIPYATGWKISPDVLARIFAEREGFHRMKIPTFHIKTDGSYQPILPKEWDVIIDDFEILTTTLKSKETYKDENYKEWRSESILQLPTGTFVWLDDLIASYNIAFSKERMHLDNERIGDRTLNLKPALPLGTSNIIYDEFESIIPKITHASFNTNKNFITFTELHQILNLDSFYGLQSAATDSILGSFYSKNSLIKDYRSFRYYFDRIPCKGYKQLELIYMWCGFYGLPAYYNNAVVELNGEILLKNWQEDFKIKLDDLKLFLKKYGLPLPSTLFPNESDTTKIRSQANEDAKNKAFYEFTVVKPKLQLELEELKNIQPENMQARKEKHSAIADIKKKIHQIDTGEFQDSETPAQRKSRLELWLKEEKHKNPRGALLRTAKREGISRQRLSQILNPKK